VSIRPVVASKKRIRIDLSRLAGEVSATVAARKENVPEQVDRR